MPSMDEMVVLVKPGDQYQEEGIYAHVARGGYDKVWLDAYGIPHDTGEFIANTPLLVARRLAVWRTKGGVRIRGPHDFTFPKTEGWLLDGVKVELDRLKVNSTTKALALRKFKPPASEAAWNEKRGKELLWKKGWKLNSFFSTPRDKMTWLKFQHRTLYTVGHSKTEDTSCRACSDRESQLHLISCSVIY